MGSYKYELVKPPEDDRARELWLQHAVGFMLFQDMRQYAIDEIDPKLSPEVREHVVKGINDAVYGLMMIIDGVSGFLRNDSESVSLKFTAQHLRESDGDGEVVQELDLADGAGFCMGYHGWLEGDFGTNAVAQPKQV